MARRTLIKTATKNGIDWTGIVKSYDNRDVYALYKQIITASSSSTESNRVVAYPDYYTRPFHAYDDGNLNWLAAQVSSCSTFIFI